LTHPIGVFNEAKELAALRSEDEAAGEEVASAGANLKKEDSKGKIASRPDSTVKSRKGSEAGQSTKELPKVDMNATGMTNMS
jgi:hypothetical protein